MQTLVILACLLFVAYLVTSVIVFKEVPPSISDTFYMYNSKKKGLGYIFTLWMVTEAFLMLPPMLELSSGEWWQLVGFLCPTLIAFCGCAPTFMDGGLVKRVHFFGAIGGAIAGLIWSYLTCEESFLLSICVCVMLTIVFSAVTETEISSKTFWMEIVGFGTIALSLLMDIIGL